MAEPSQETSQGNEEKIEKLNQTDTKEGAEEKNEENNFDMSDEAKNVKPTDFSLINYEKHKRKAISHDLSGSGSLMTHKTPSSDVITCFLCNKMVEGKFVHALGRTWHPEHFHCAQCKNPILASKFNHKDGDPFCEQCYANLFLKKCEVCREPIREKVVVAMDKTYHAEHFLCTVCYSVLGDVFFEKEGKAYCETCNIKLFAPVCASCELPILETAIIALDQKWHQDCFICARCYSPVKEKTFQVVDDRPICAECSTVNL